ncbi:hypothetical protein DNTS_025830 [Danionella cerebrum]|uniref:glucuronosyltransferase n=1 Tax=Danionella cerebrum TaxID=2873325 RepID=A0A553NA14_9TELE|nr:hypothetical protein DNTS_025830 [Danionella translucida]
MDGSHWNGVKAVAEEMGRRGHKVTVVIPEVSLLLGPGKYYVTRTFPVPYGQKTLDELQARNAEVMENKKLPLLEKISTRISNIRKFVDFQRATAKSLLLNQELVDFIRRQNFDAVLTSPAVPTGAILAYNLSLPAVYMLRGLPCGLDSEATACPNPPSYVPRFFTHSSDHMSFRQRVLNVLVSIVEPFLCKLIYWTIEDVASNFLQRDVSVAEILRSGALWLLRYDFSLEFPKPLMPNMVLIGGINCASTHPLSETQEVKVHNLGKMLRSVSLCLALVGYCAVCSSVVDKFMNSSWTGKLLVLPMDGSHWTGVKAVAEEMGRRGHTVIVVIPEVSMRLGPGQHYITKTFPVPYKQDLIRQFIKEHVDELTVSDQSLVQSLRSTLNNFAKVINFMTSTAESLFNDQELIEFLRKQDFDAILTDPAMPMGAILAYNLSVPTVYMLRGMMCEAKFTSSPDPLSYIPRFFSQNSDRMSFRQRVSNLLVGFLEPLFCNFVFGHFEDLASKFLQRDISMVEILQTAVVWLMRYDFTLEFPKPFMPNMKFIGGINCEVKSPLEKKDSRNGGWTGKLLVVPMDGSHWTEVKAVAEEMGRRGHTVVVVFPEMSLSLGPGKHFITKTFPGTYGQDLINQMVIDEIEQLTSPVASIVSRITTKMYNLGKILNLVISTTESLFTNQELIDFLREQHFDAALVDPAMPLGPILAHNLSLPVVFMLRALICDASVTACPAPPSYVPRFLSLNSDRMTFGQRVMNSIISMLEPLMCTFMFWPFEKVASNILQKDIILKEILRNGTFWLMRYDFTLEFPKPLIPNVALIGGISCQIKNPLAKPAVVTPNMLLFKVMLKESWWRGLGKGLLLLLWLTAWLRPAQGGRVLVMPVEGSHWLSMKVLATELAQRGHDIVVLVPENNILIQSSNLFRTETFPVNISKEELSTSLKGFQQGVFIRSPALMDIYIQVYRLLQFTGLQVRGCASLLYNEPLMMKLKKENFDLVLTDPFLPCGTIISTALQVPAVYFLRGMPCGLDLMALQCPSPPSYVPRFQSGSSDQMTFVQRFQNFLMSGIELMLCKIMYASFDELAARYLDADVTYKQLMGQGAIWLLRYEFTFEYPRPIMPNMVFIGGINCQRSRELSAEVEDFVNGSGEHGIVVFTLGSMVSSMPKEKAAIFFQAFSKIPQRVLWRYAGEMPENVPENVKLMKWLPQNDLLAFITHGGTHGIYEGICHGVPMVMLPLFGDQADNVHRVATRGVGVILSIHDITAETLLDALNTVINDSSYKDRMKKLSAIHNDRPVQPLDLAVFWTEFVMRHKGADHLRPAAHDLNWVQYHSLDVIGFLLLIVLVFAIAMFKCCSLCWRRCCQKALKKKED